MSLLNGARQSVNNLSGAIKNPFDRNVTSGIRLDDFTDGFQFEELTGPRTKVKLNGSLMPHIPFTFGGEQKIVKDYYAGQTEPSVQVLGSRESDLTINGRFYDKRYSESDLYGVATEIQQLCDSLRIRGNVLRIYMGEFQRYGILKGTDFKLRNLGDIEYTLTFDIIGFNAPINGKFIEKKKEVPFEINNELIDIANELQDLDGIPTTVPLSIADAIRGFTSDIAGAINILTDFVDTVISTVNDIKKAVQRVLGLVKHLQNKLRDYKRFLASITSFDPASSIAGRYENASFYSGQIGGASSLTSLLQRFRAQMLSVVQTLPLGRHIVKEGESLQKISVKFYDTPDNWKEIYDHNQLQSADLTEGQLLEIPRL